jgi:hypothetical protein
VLLATVALLAMGAACTGSSAPSGSPSGSTSAPTDTTTTPLVITPGAFRYANAGLVVTLTLKTNTGTMSVDNGSDHDLGKPDLYVLDGSSGKQIDGRVVDPQPIAQGAKATFHVEFPPEVNDKEIGLVVLLFGTDNYGAFAPA